jgi:cellulose synthase/poly-beta-1,6-N-acetylglucosamine synthase-like glycosyltransferase
MLKKIFLTLILAGTCSAQQNPGLLIKIPTRSRPEKFFTTLDHYEQLLSGTVRTLFLISCDSNDASMNQEKYIKKFKNYSNVVVRFSNNHSKIEAYNKDIDEFINDWDVLLVTSDDMEPMVQGYDKIIMETMQKQFPDFDGVLNFHDGFLGDVLNTYPIIGKNFYQRFGYIYHPAYQSLACDLELTVVSKMLKKEYADSRVLIKHNHPNNGTGTWDPLYQYNESLLPIDKQTFFERRLRRFDLHEEELAQVCSADLSIIIGSMHRNVSKIKELKQRLAQQIKKLKRPEKIELLCCTPNCEFNAEVTNQLQKANGYYVVYIDAGFNPINDYLIQVLEAIKNKPDICGISITNGSGKTGQRQSISHHPCKINFLNPVKRYLAVQFNSPDNRWGSNNKWAEHLLETKVLKQEIMIKKSLYQKF